VSDDHSIVNKFATYFSEVQNSRVCETLSPMPSTVNATEDTDLVGKWFFSTEDVDKAVRSLKFGKASGADGITTEHLRHAHCTS